MAFIGYVDSFAGGRVSGWATDTAKPNQPVSVTIYVNDRVATQVTANVYRADLEQHGIGDGKKAFDAQVSLRASQLKEGCQVKVCFDGTQQVLTNGLLAPDKGSAEDNISKKPKGSWILRLLAPDKGSAQDNPWNRDTPYDYSTLWFGAKQCRDYINRTITGDPDQHWLPYVVNKYVATHESRTGKKLADCRCLLLGINEGYMAQELCANGFTGEIVATDIAEKALQRAKQRTDALGYHNIKYVAHDLNLPPEDKFFGSHFDFIFAEGVLHHIENIGPCLDMCRDNLTEDGFLFMVEFEGPFRFQLSDLQVRWINAALNVLPKCLRPFPKTQKDVFPPNLKEIQEIFYVLPKEKEIEKMDPSEALSGPELKELIPQVFEIVERKGYGGTLLSYMTCHFDFKRTNQDPFAARWLKVLMEIEQAAIDSKILDDEFVFYVVKKRRAA